jgi:phospholipid/cholesterol/gamma-HCH transport system substrate-binding protein
MRNNIVETIMGAIVLIVTGSFLYFAFNHSKASSSAGYMLTAKFDKIDGLSIGGDVKISGINVGVITGYRLDPETFMAVIEMKINSSIKLPDDTFAKITSEGLLGGNYLVLDPGGSDEYLSEGDEILDTQGSIDFLRLLDKFAGGSDDDKKDKK